MELLIHRLKRISDIFCLIKDVLKILYGLAKIMYIYCINLFMSLFTILSQSIIGKMLPSLWQRRLEKNSNLVYSKWHLPNCKLAKDVCDG